jgi:hypothetical protein
VTNVAATGAVYDRGYRPYEGDRGGRSSSRAALLRLSIRRALGLRRSWRQKVFPWTLLGIATIPAILNVGIGYLTQDSPIEDFEFFTYREYVGVSTALLLFLALTAPDIVCPDRRNRVLPLIFARPLSGNDYVGAKVGAMALILFGFSFLPQVVLFVGQTLVTDDGALEYFTDNVELLWQVPIAVAFLALHYAALGIALSSITTRRVVGGVTILAVALVTSVVSQILLEVDSGAEDGASWWALVNILALPLHVRDLVFLGNMDPEGSLAGIEGAGVAVVVESIVIITACLLFLRHRYREVSV